MSNNQRLLAGRPEEPALESAAGSVSASSSPSPSSSSSSSSSAGSTGAGGSAPAGQLIRLIEFRKRQESAAKRLKASDEPATQPTVFRKDPPAIISQSYSKNLQKASIIRTARPPPPQALAVCKRPEAEQTKSDPKSQPTLSSSNPTTTTTTATTTLTTGRAVFKEPAILLTGPASALPAPPASGKLNALPDAAPKLPALLVGQQASSGEPAGCQPREIAIIPPSKFIISPLVAGQPNQLQQPDQSASKHNHHQAAGSAARHQAPAASPSVAPTSAGNAKATPSLPNSQARTSSPSPSLSAGQPVNARLIDMGKKLLEAARDGQTELVRQLVVSAGAPFTSDWLGTTALHLAAQNGFVEVAEILLAGGVNRDARTKLERTALHCAAQSGSLDIVDLLLVHGCDVNACDMLKMTPLHWAVERGHHFVAERLLLSGADASAINKFQLTPIEIAQQSESYEMLRLFQKCAGSGSNVFAECSTAPSGFMEQRVFRSPSFSENLAVNNFLSINFSTDDDIINFNESHDITDELDYTRLSFEKQQQFSTNGSSSRTSLEFDITEPCIDLVEFELNTLKFEPDFFLSNEDEEGYDEEGDEEEDEEEEEGGTKVEYLMKVVENLQKENKQLRQTVEHLQTK